MASDLDVLFYTGILIPTGITVGFFIGFLICWFQCDLRTKLTMIRQRNQRHQHQPAVKSQNSKSRPEGVEERMCSSAFDVIGELGDQLEKASQHSADSAIDLGEVEMCPVEEASGPTVATTPPQHTLSEQIKRLVNNSANTQVAADTSSHDDQDYNLSKGSYPSYEKLDEEIHSEPRIYESQDDIEMAMINGFLNTRRCSQLCDVDSKRRPLIHSVPQPAMLVHAVPAILTLNHTTEPLCHNAEMESDYGFKTWRPERSSRPSSLASVAVISAANPPKPARLEWRPYLTYKHNKDHYSVEIMHV